MQFYKTKQCIILPVLATIITFTLLSLPGLGNQYANSQSNETNSTSNTTSTGVELKDILPSPLHLKSGSKFQIIATVVNDSPNKITFTAGVCDSPLSAQFLKNVVIRYMQGCTATSPPFRITIWRRSYCSGTIFWHNLSSISSWTNNSERHFSLPD